ncbi:MAG: hypothetical protein AAB484_02295 [Patescibacteria group bacterium]
MKEFQERRRFRKLLHSRYVIAILFILCILLGRAVWNMYGKYEKSKTIAERTKVEFSALEKREKLLNQGITDLNTNLGKEREIRERFRVVKEGERMIVLVENESLSESISSIAWKSWWDKLSGFFGFFRRD